jgi:inositol-phosphate phosphatase / L-galactose 1-phosphate phosphatase / histidinol-phosphatase
MKIDEQLKAVAVRLADAARDAAMQHFLTPLDAERKADASPVTRADREAEQAMRVLLEGLVPGHGVVGEEFGATRPDAEFVWVLDPIDGTKAYVTGKPLWGTLIALLRDGEPYLGIIDLGALNQRWVGLRGAATTLNGVPCHTSGCEILSQARLGCTSPDIFTAAKLTQFNALGREVWFRSFGGDCAAYATLASGHLELVVEAGLQNHDYAALVPVVQGAGGVITDWQGRQLLGHGEADVVAAANPTMHQAALDALGH